MTTTETTTDTSVLGVTIPAELIARTQQAIAEVRAILTDAQPILDRAQAVYAEAGQVGQNAYLAAKMLTDDRDALDAVGTLVGVLTGAAELNFVLGELAGASDPDRGPAV